MAIMVEGEFRRNPAVAGSGFSALEWGRLKLWVIGHVGKGIFPMGFEAEVGSR